LVSSRTRTTYKELVPNKIWLCFGKADDDGGPYFGYWVESTVSSKIRENLFSILGGWKFDDNASAVVDSGVRRLNTTGVWGIYGKY
jgi:hypothetical protein